MNYTLTVKAKGKVLAKQELKTKTDEDMPPFEIISTEMKIDTYKDIASFEILIDTKNWNDSINLNDADFILRVSNNQNSVDFNISTNYNYKINQNIELIYDLSKKQIGLANTLFTLRGDISNLGENSNYTMTFLRKNDKMVEKSFETNSLLKGLEIQTKTN